MMIPEVCSKSEVTKYTNFSAEKLGGGTATANVFQEEQLIFWREKCASEGGKTRQLEQENEVLKHCWYKALEDIQELERKCNLLQGGRAVPCQ